MRRWVAVFAFLAFLPRAHASIDPVEDQQIEAQQIQVLKNVDGALVNSIAQNPRVYLPEFQDLPATTPSVFEQPLNALLAFYPGAFGFQRLNGLAQVNWGILSLRGYDLLTLKITPKRPNGKLVIFAHGYLDHVGCNTRFFEQLARQGTTVVTFDLPGHGLSTGTRGSIPNFDIYGQIVADLVTKFAGQQELTLVGFSTGASAILVAREHGWIPAATRAILVAPLVRMWGWQIAEPVFLKAYYARFNWGWRFLAPLVSPQTFVRATSHDEGFLQVQRLDPLRPGNIPAEWTLAYINYANELERWGASLTDDQRAQFGETLVVQGQDDGVVDGNRAVDFVTKTFFHSQAQWIPAGRHQLLNESSIATRDLPALIYNPILEFIAR